MGLRIKDITTLVQSVNDTDKLPISQGGNDAVAVTAAKLKEYISQALAVVHVEYTAQDGVIAFVPSHLREYGRASVSANASVVLNISNTNDHYLLITNTSNSAITITISGNSSETIIGSSSISIPASGTAEMSVIKDNSKYIVTHYIFS